jgi:hypothetical protein
MNLPQNHLLNPALRPSNSFYLGLPALTGININLNNNFVNFSDIIMPSKTQDSLISFLHPDYNVDNFISKLKDKNFLAPEVNIQLFGLGFNAGKDLYVFLDIVDRIEGNVVFPIDLFKLGLKGNGDFVGKTIDLSNLGADLKYYHELGFGFSKNFTKKLRIGVRGKILFGVADFSIENKSLGLTINNDYTYALNADLSANISAPVKVYTNNQNGIDSVIFDLNRFKKVSSDKIDIHKVLNYIFNTKNLGLGIDIGATYSISDKIQLSASITDLGFISWKRDVTNLKAESQFKFSGFNITDVINGSKTFDEIAREMADSLKNSFTVTKNNKTFKTFLPTGVSVGGSFNLTKSFSLGILSYSKITSNQFREAFTMSANLNLDNAFSTSVSYTAENRRYDNLGFGLAFRPGIFQFYFIADKIPIMWDKIKYDNTVTTQGPFGSVETKTSQKIYLPESWNTVNLRLGMNIAFGNNIKKKNDKPMLMKPKHKLRK